MLIMKLEKKKDKEEVLEKGEEIGRLWRVEMDEDLMMEKRKRRCRMVEMARRERAKGKKMELSNRKLRMESRR